jgi:ATP-dependent helicase/nuclease subunit A
MRSALWQRAQSSARCLVEVPFATSVEPLGESSQGVPLILRGVLDLAFREAEGWVIVDYKTEEVGVAELRQLADYYRQQVATYAFHWSRLISEPVAETGLFFTHSSAYVRL